MILVRVYDLLMWLVPRSKRFPRVYRHTVTQRLLDAALDVHDGLLRAQAHRGRPRRAALADVDAALNCLRGYLRLVHAQAWISGGQYEHVSRMVAEVGRLLGGWVKAEEKTGARG